MIHYYLTPITGKGTSPDEPYYPLGAELDNPLHSWIFLDRPGSPGEGQALLSTPDRLPDRAERVYQGDGPQERLTSADKGTVESRLSVLLEDDQIDRMIAELLIGHGDATGRDKWRPLRPSRRNRRYEIWLGGLLWSAPVVAGGATIGDTFEAATNTTLASHTATGPNGGHSWDAVAPELTVIAASNTLGLSTSSLGRYRASAALDTKDMAVTVTIAVKSSADTLNVSPLARVAAAGDSAYAYLLRERADAQHRLFRISGGGFSQVGSSVSDDLPSVPFDGTLEVDGSSLTGLIDTVAKIGPSTDTNFDDVRRGGVLSGDGWEIGSWLAADLAAGAEQDITAPTADVVVEAEALTLATQQAIPAPTGEVVTEALAPTLRAEQSLVAPMAEVVLEAPAPALAAEQSVVADTADIVVEALNPTMAAEAPTLEIIAPTAEVVYEAENPSLVGEQSLVAPLAEVVYEAPAPTMATELSLLGDTAEIVNEGQVPAFALVGAFLAPTGEVVYQALDPVMIAETPILVGVIDLTSRFKREIDLTSHAGGV